MLQHLYTLPYYRYALSCPFSLSDYDCRYWLLQTDEEDENLVIDDPKQLESIPLPEGVERISDDEMIPDEIPLPQIPQKPKICIQV
jgi:hypothetical protein